MKTISRYIMTLALLLTAVTGAWAQSYEAKVFDVPASWEEDNTPLSAADLPKDFVQITEDEAKALAVPDGIVLLIYGFEGENVNMMQFENGTFSDEEEAAGAVREVRGNFRIFQVANAIICYTAAAGPAVAWDAATKTGTFAMPGSDVVLTPIYAKAAAFATTGTEPEVKTLLPEAAEGVIAGTDAPLIAEGTGIVAFAGTSTEVTQGTLMYAIGTSDTEAPALTDFNATVPTAENVADDGADVLVWYYIQGADAPQGEAATLDNTFENTEPACLTVTVLTNKFDITLNAANANTIEAGKATVTVGGTAATVTEGKLEGVKMGSEVKLEAKPGYKFRKVEVKKKGDESFTEVTNFSELQTALSAGKDVKLKNDIDCTAEINITSDGALTIDGNGKKLSTTSEIRAFKVGSSATVAFKDLTLTGFVSGGGPAINNSGTIVLDGCTISNCHVNNSNGGGAIESTGKLYAINTTFSGNYSGEIGGAINNYWGRLYMSGCTFTDNCTTENNAYYGGAIGINGGSEVRLINCSFSGNQYGMDTGTNDIGVYSKPTNYTIAGCTGVTIASRNGDITTIATGTATLDYSDLSNISFTYTAE